MSGAARHRRSRERRWAAGAAALAWIGAGLWVWKAVTVHRGLRQLPDLRRAAYDRRLADEPRVAVVVPACDEAKSIGLCVRSLVAQDYGNLHVIAVDDRSRDGTGGILDRLGAESPTRVTVLHVHELPAGWLGKTHAMALAAQHAHHAEWLLFTDGDVLFHPQALRRSVAAAELMGADHLVTLPTAILRSPGEAILIGFLQLLGLSALRLWKVADPRARDAAGVGAFNLLRAAAYNQVGGFGALRMQVLDDLALARRVKDTGLRQRVVLAPGFVRVHWAAGVRGIVHTMTKNLFAVVRFRVTLLLLACGGVVLLFLAPFACLLFVSTRPPASVALSAMLSIYVSVRRLTRVPAWTIAGLPLGAALFVYALLRSGAVTLRQQGVAWRGAFYPLRELRRHALRVV